MGTTGDSTSTCEDQHWQDGLERLSEEQHQRLSYEDHHQGDEEPVIPFFSTLERPHWNAVSSSGLLRPRETWACCSESGHRNDQGLEPLSSRGLGSVGVHQLEQRMHKRSSFQCVHVPGGRE